MKRHPERYGYKIAVLLGIVFYPTFFILDLIIYPEHITTLISIRVIVTVGFVISYMLMDKLDERYLYVSMYVTFFYAAFGITLMCILTGDGFASSYYSGIFLVFMGASIFYRISMKAFVTVMCCIILQHFILLMFIPFTLEDLFINLFALGSCTVISMIIHYALLQLYEENSLLKQFIPICANCKKVRDDKGYWDQVERYIEAHSEASFSHSICPQCAAKLYGDYLHGPGGDVDAHE